MIYNIKKNLIWSLIPAKGTSKRIYKKNLKKINNLPLVCYSVIFSKMSKEINQTFVSTDCKIIKKISEKYGANVPFLRPKKYSKNGSQDFQYVDHFINFFKNKGSYLPEYIIQLRPTTPFRSQDDLRKALNKIKKYPSANSMRSSHIADHPPEKQFRIKGRYYTNVNLKKIINNNFNKPSHLFRNTYEPNGYIDILKTSYLLKNKMNIYGKKILPFITRKTIDIDTEEDFEYAKKFDSLEKKIILKYIQK